MKNRNKLVAWVVLMISLVAIGFTTIPPAKAQFILADYVYPPPNGNGIAYISIFIDGDYVDTMYNNPDSYPTATPTNPLDIDAGVTMTLQLECWINGTFMDISSLAEGLLIMRHSIVITRINGTTVFSQQNFTYVSGTDAFAPMYNYKYTVILDFVPEHGEYYTATVTYELWW